MDMRDNMPQDSEAPAEPRAQIQRSKSVDDKWVFIRPRAASVQPPLSSPLPCYLRKRDASREDFRDGLCTCGMTAQEKQDAANEEAFIEKSTKYNEKALRCLSHEDDLAFVKAGTFMWKLRSATQWYRRKFIVDLPAGIIRQLPRHGNSSDVRLRDILEVREGCKTDVWTKMCVAIHRKRRAQSTTEMLSKTGWNRQEGCCFSLVLDKNGKRVSLDLVCATTHQAALWIRTIRRLLDDVHGLKSRDRFIRWAFEKFDRADEDKDDKLYFKEVLQFLKLLNISKTTDEAMELFKAATAGVKFDGKPYLDHMTMRIFFMKLMRSSDKIQIIYNTYASSGANMTEDELCAFLQQEQHLTPQESRALASGVGGKVWPKEKNVTIWDFSLAIMIHFPILMPEHVVSVYQDMSQPLNNYYIASSHNTYLLGRQIMAQSTTEGYVVALKRGCRCLELDCWDGVDGEPVVMHGYALTTKIPFRKILLSAILPNAFVDSEFPLILSLENHCCDDQQKRMAFHLKEVFGDLLYTDPVDPELERLPSPEQLKRKIIIKARKKISQNMDRRESLQITHITTSDDSVKGNGSQAELEESLSDIINICQGSPFQGFEKKGKCYEMVSLSENKALQLAEGKPLDLLEYNTRRLSRIYPAAMRTDSSNFNPFPFWNCGCQLVALNYQGAGKPVLFNEAKFSVNGRCGYVLKPEFLRQPNLNTRDYHPKTRTGQTGRAPARQKTCYIEVNVISGKHLPTVLRDGKVELVNPFVSVKIVGHPAETGKGKTPTVSQNGFDPVWDCSFRFEVAEPELAFLYFVVKHDSNTREKPVKLGYCAVPFTSVAQGTRAGYPGRCDRCYSGGRVLAGCWWGSGRRRGAGPSASPCCRSWPWPSATWHSPPPSPLL